MTIPQSHKRVDGGRMAGPQAVPNVIEVVIMCTGANGKSANFACYGAYTTAPPSLATLASALWTAISTGWSTNLAALMHPSASINSVHVRDMTQVTNPVVVGSGTAISGTGTPPAMPPDVCAVLTENVNARGRGAKGRMYISGFVEGAGAGAGVMSSATETAVNAFGAAIFAALQAQSLVPCVAQVHRQQYIGITGTTHPDRPANHVNAQNYLVRNTSWDTQRRRGEP